MRKLNLMLLGGGIDLVNGVAAWKIEVPHWIPVKTENPHITAALRDSSVKPFLASNIKNWVPLKEQFVIGGIFREVRSIQE